MRPRTRHLLRTAAVAMLLAASACVPPPKPAPVPTPAPRPVRVPVPTPTPAPAPSTYNHWSDAPQTAGDWSYSAGVATFGQPGQPALTLRCPQRGQPVEITVMNAASQVVTIRTEWMDRTIAAMTTASPPAPAASPARTIVSLPANDALLDAMAFSKGRFAVESSGLATLYVPAWPEVIRVIEDCR